MRDLDNYIKPIESECEGFEVLSISAIKIDGDAESLKNNLGLDQLKSCDYIKTTDSGVIFIEVTDLVAQKTQLDIRVSELRKLKVTEDGTKTSLSTKELQLFFSKNVIIRELKEKFISTQVIFCSIEKRFDLTIKSIYSFFVVLCCRNISDLIAFDEIQRSLKTELKGLVSNIKFIPFPELINHI
jgi:hypothetical protein